MISPEVTGFGDTARMRDDRNRVLHIFLVVVHSLRLIYRVKSSLQLRVVGGDPSGAGVLITLKSLDAAQRKHKAARRHAEISPHAKCPCDICWCYQLATGDHLDPVL